MINKLKQFLSNDYAIKIDELIKKVADFLEDVADQMKSKFLDR